MSYKQIKWLILVIPTLTIGTWEYVRHAFLLPYISMNLGNWLAPVIVFLVTLLFLTQLFTMMEQNQEELNKAKALQAALEEREKIARELHDGIAQTLFLLNVQVNQIEKTQNKEGIPLKKFKRSVRQANTYVRQAIANLRSPVDPVVIPWMQGLESIIEELKRETDLCFHINWNLSEDKLSSKEKIELVASIREILLNIRKHADALNVYIEAEETEDGWQCLISDDGVGFTMDQISDDKYGIKMMEDCAKMLNWQFKIERKAGRTLVVIRKGEVS